MSLLQISPKQLDLLESLNIFYPDPKNSKSLFSTKDGKSLQGWNLSAKDDASFHSPVSLYVQRGVLVVSLIGTPVWPSFQVELLTSHVDFTWNLQRLSVRDQSALQIAANKSYDPISG